MPVLTTLPPPHLSTCQYIQWKRNIGREVRTIERTMTGACVRACLPACLRVGGSIQGGTLICVRYRFPPPPAPLASLADIDREEQKIVKEIKKLAKEVRLECIAMPCHA